MSRIKIVQDPADIVDPGLKVVTSDGSIHKDWISDAGFPYCYGYSVNRRINCGDKVICVTNSIKHRDLDNHPMFESKLSNYDGEKSCFLTSNSTTTFREVLKELKIPFKPKSVKGFRFFGFHTKEYLKKSSQCGTINIDAIKKGECESRTVMDVTHSTHSRLCSWTGVLSYGSPLCIPSFTVVINGTTCSLQPGYTAVRTVNNIEEGTVHRVTIGIENLNNQPNFTALINTYPPTT